MPYELLEKELESLTVAHQEAVMLFVRFLAAQDAGRTVSLGKGVRERKLGGFEKDFFMASDFDGPIEEFAEYM